MQLQHKTNKRRGTVLPLVAICLAGIMGLVALAIDIGIISIARNQCQNAADSSAMAGARTITGDTVSNFNVGAMPTNAVIAATANSVFGVKIPGNPNTNWAKGATTFTSGNVTVEVGAYAYVYNDTNPAKEGFQIQFPPVDSDEPYSACRTTVVYTGNFAFGKVFGLKTFNTKAQATAVHRPRDVVIVLDLSGSMRFESMPGIPYYGARTASMQTDVYPKFGHYSDTKNAALYGNKASSAPSGELYDVANLTITTNSGPPIVDDWYQNPAGVAPSTASLAFTRWSNSYDLIPGGDNYPAKFGTGTSPPTYAATVNQALNANGVKNATFETTGYGSGFYGYTQGPGYWGKTFFIWPPDPRKATSTDMSVAANQTNNGAKDWRQRFFIKYNTSTKAMTPLDDNLLLWNTDGSFLAPHTSVTVSELDAKTLASVNVSYHARINYAAILKWLIDNPQSLPPILRAGRIRYYDAIPNPSVDSGINNRLWTTQNGGSDNDRFWRGYIDFVLGVQTTGVSNGLVTYSAQDNNNTNYSAMIGNGDTYAWGTTKISQKPNPTSQPDYITGGKINKSGGYAVGATALTLTGVPTVPLAGDTIAINTGSSRRFYTVTASPAPTKTSVTITPGLVTAVSNSTTVTFRRPGDLYMDYDDNPLRPRHHYWFGAQTIMDYLGNYNLDTFWWPGNCHEAQAWALKAGVQTALDDIRSNHPSDYIGVCFFSDPANSGKDKAGQYNAPVVPIGRDYDKLKQSLWFPPSTITGGKTEIGMFDPDMNSVPRSHGYTTPGMGFLLAYNMLSSSTTLRLYPQPQANYRGVCGGLGRKGASRLVIFETDGCPNTGATASLAGSGTDSYYPIRLYNPANYTDSKNKEWPTNPGYDDDDVFSIIKQITALDTANPPGFSTKRKDALVYALGYGSLYDPANASTAQKTGITFLQSVQYYGGTSPDTNYKNFPPNQLIYGPSDTSVGGRIDRMQKAFSAIMQEGVQVSLVQ